MVAICSLLFGLCLSPIQQEEFEATGCQRPILAGSIEDKVTYQTTHFIRKEIEVIGCADE